MVDAKGQQNNVLYQRIQNGAVVWIEDVIQLHIQVPFELTKLENWIFPNKRMNRTEKA